MGRHRSRPPWATCAQSGGGERAHTHISRTHTRARTRAHAHAHARRTSFAGDHHGHHEDRQSLRTKVAYWRSTSLGGAALDAADTALSVLSVAIYVVYTYVTGHESAMPLWMQGAEVVFTLCFAADFAVTLLAAKKGFALSWRTVADVLTLLPICVIAAGADYDLIVKLLRLCRVLRILHAKAAGRVFRSEIKQQLFSIGFTVTSLTIIGASIINVVENTEALWPANRDLVDVKHLAGFSWFDSFWMCAISNLTVGFGD